MKVSLQLRNEIDKYLEKVKAHLRGKPAEESQEILANIESHIYEALERKYGECPDCSHLMAVLAEMDPPELYDEDSKPEDGAPPAGGKSSIKVYVILALVLLAMLTALFWVLDPPDRKTEERDAPASNYVPAESGSLNAKVPRQGRLASAPPENIGKEVATKPSALPPEGKAYSDTTLKGEDKPAAAALQNEASLSMVKKAEVYSFIREFKEMKFKEDDASVPNELEVKADGAQIKIFGVKRTNEKRLKKKLVGHFGKLVLLPIEVSSGKAQVKIPSIEGITTYGIALEQPDGELKTLPLMIDSKITYSWGVESDGKRILFAVKDNDGKLAGSLSINASQAKSFGFYSTVRYPGNKASLTISFGAVQQNEKENRIDNASQSKY